MSGAYEIENINSVGGVQRALEIAFLDTLSLDASLARSRTIFYGALVVLKALEIADLVDRIKTLEAAVLAHREQHESVFDKADELDDPFPLPGGES